MRVDFHFFKRIDKIRSTLTTRRSVIRLAMMSLNLKIDRVSHPLFVKRGLNYGRGTKGTGKLMTTKTPHHAN